jgi:hypothetical protein
MLAAGPSAVLCSRTVVADRARPVDGMVAVRLDPFGEGHVRQWLDVWNAANSPIPAEAVLAHTELAAQPLLLLLLALYHAEGHPLRRDDQPLDQAELYERLLTRFAEREVRKLGAGLPNLDYQRALDRELLRLSVVAFGMFNRRRQWVSAAEVDTDLAVLLDPQESQPTMGMRAPVTAAEDVIGKFFFIHRAQAVRGDQRLTTYEFLHATFGEYLIARLVARELDDLVATAELEAVRTRQAPLDDAFPHALLSFAPLTMRYTTVLPKSTPRGAAPASAFDAAAVVAVFLPQSTDGTARQPVRRVPAGHRLGTRPARGLLSQPVVAHRAGQRRSQRRGATPRPTGSDPGLVQDQFTVAGATAARRLAAAQRPAHDHSRLGRRTSQPSR